MSEKRAEYSEFELKSKYGEIERFVLFYLYDHPGWDATTYSLAKTHQPAALGSEEAKGVFIETQYGIETLIADELVSGERKSGADGVYFEKLKLTKRGEAEAIVQKRQPAKLVHSVPRPDRQGK